jgi:glycosyltransferase involved in cell wall biosynthesis
MASVLAQTHDDLELIVLDDAGDLADIAAATGDERVRYHRAPAHLGPAGRYKAAVALCRGRYVGLLDDDDRYEPTSVSRLLSALEADPGAAAAVSPIVWDIDGKLVQPLERRVPGPQTGRVPGPQTDAAHAFVDCRWIVTPSSALLRASALEHGERACPMPDDVTPDLFVNARAAAAGWRFVLVDSPPVVKRWHDGQISRDGLEPHDRAVATWRQLQLDDPELDRLRRSQLSRSHARRAGFRLLEGDMPGAREDLREAGGATNTWRWRRRMLGAAVLVPPAGRAGLRLHRSVSAFRLKLWQRST